jgi:predicted membrane-bound mannosyltransferase
MVVYSIIPYKTPWSMMTFWNGCIIISAYGIAEVLNRSKKYLKTLLLIFITAVILHQIWQSYNITFTYSFHPSNPFVYSQATRDVELISNRIKDITDNVPDKDQTYISIIAPKHDYWPLPWYLRSFKNISWTEYFNSDIYHYPIILAKPELEQELIETLYSSPPAGEKNLYIPLFDQYMELRPGVEIRGYIKKELYDSFMKNKSGLTIH